MTANDNCVELNGATVLFKADNVWADRDRNRKTRIYTEANDELVREYSGMENHPSSYDGCKVARGKGEDANHDKATCELCALDAAWRQWNRAEMRVAKEAATAWLKANGLGDVKVRFDRHAGCSCPCSPGLVADRVVVLTHKNREVREYYAASESMVTVTKDQARRVDSVHV